MNSIYSLTWHPNDGRTLAVPFNFRQSITAITRRVKQHFLIFALYSNSWTFDPYIPLRDMSFPSLPLILLLFLSIVRGVKRTFSLTWFPNLDSVFQFRRENCCQYNAWSSCADWGIMICQDLQVCQARS